MYNLRKVNELEVTDFTIRFSLFDTKERELYDFQIQGILEVRILVKVVGQSQTKGYLSIGRESLDYVVFRHRRITHKSFFTS